MTVKPAPENTLGVKPLKASMKYPNDGGIDKIPLNLAKELLPSIVDPVKPQIGNHAIKEKKIKLINMFPLTLYFSKTIIVMKAKPPRIKSGLVISPIVTSVTG